jgi:hypothetical protein
MRGHGNQTPWTDAGFEGYFLRYRDKSGTAPNGTTGSGPIAVIGYPGEDVYIIGAPTSGGTISAVNGESFPGMGQWAVIADLRIEGNGNDGPISHEIYGSHWRVVNNDLSAPHGDQSNGGNGSNGAGITGNGLGEVWIGNHIHDIAGGTDLQNHGIYIDGAGSYEIAYNVIENVTGGSGFQIFINGGNGSSASDDQSVPFAPYTAFIHFHHNQVHDVAKYLVNLADGSASGIEIYDNVAYNGAIAGLRFNTTNLSGCKIWNNTFRETDTGGSSAHGALMNDWNFAANAYDIRNNIFAAHAGTPYSAGSNGMPAGQVAGPLSKNLYFGGSGTPSFDSSAVLGDPRFVNGSAGDLHLGVGSAAIDQGVDASLTLVTDDYDLVTQRPLGAHPDLGAYERRP